MMDPEELDNLFYRKNPLNRHHMNPVGNFLNEFIPELVTEICFHLTVGETQILLALVTPCVPHELVRTAFRTLDTLPSLPSFDHFEDFHVTPQCSLNASGADSVAV